MAEVHHFEYGWITPLMAYCLSVLGSLLGLICTARVRAMPTARKRIGWLILAAVAIGGTGIWVMHFMAMLGFGVVGSDIRYDVPTTALSALVSVTVVGLGLFIVGLGKPSVVKIAIGGVIMGLGVNAMHYMGMAAMRLDGDVDYDMMRVGASIAIAVVAATVALFLSVTVRTGAAIFGSAMVMGVAVCGMHYTGMSAMSVQLEEHGQIAGATSMTLIAPIALAVVFVVMGLIYSVLAAPTDEDRAGTAYINARLSGAPAPDTSRWTPEVAPVGGAGRERPGGLWAANREAATRTPADMGAGQARGSGLAGYGASSNDGGPNVAAASNGATGSASGAGSDIAPGLGASLLASQQGAPQAGGNRWEGLTDQGRPVSPAPVEYQQATPSEPLPQRSPGPQPAAGAPRPPTSATLAQQFQNRPRTTQDH